MADRQVHWRIRDVSSDVPSTGHDVTHILQRVVSDGDWADWDGEQVLDIARLEYKTVRSNKPDAEPFARELSVFLVVNLQATLGRLDYWNSLTCFRRHDDALASLEYLCCLLAGRDLP